VRAGFTAPPRTLVIGSPARIVRELEEREIAWKANGTREYQELARRSLRTLVACEPLPAVEAGRPDKKPIVAIPLHKAKAQG
jgi:phenylacetic acid degradation protein